MAYSIKKKLYSWLHEARELGDELVFDYPWLWVGLALFIGIKAGKKTLCCGRKKCDS